MQHEIHHESVVSVGGLRVSVGSVGCCSLFISLAARSRTHLSHIYLSIALLMDLSSSTPTPPPTLAATSSTSITSSSSSPSLSLQNAQLDSDEHIVPPATEAHASFARLELQLIPEVLNEEYSDRVSSLDLSHNKLSNLENLECFTRLVALDLSHNLVPPRARASRRSHSRTMPSPHRKSSRPWCNRSCRAWHQYSRISTSRRTRSSTSRDTRSRRSCSST